MTIEEIIKNYINDNKSRFINRYFSHHINPEDSGYYIDIRYRTKLVTISGDGLIIEPLIINDNNYNIDDLDYIIQCCLKNIDCSKRRYEM